MPSGTAGGGPEQTRQCSWSSIRRTHLQVRLRHPHRLNLGLCRVKSSESVARPPVVCRAVLHRHLLGTRCLQVTTDRPPDRRTANMMAAHRYSITDLRDRQVGVHTNEIAPAVKLPPVLRIWDRALA